MSKLYRFIADYVPVTSNTNSCHQIHIIKVIGVAGNKQVWNKAADTWGLMGMDLIEPRTDNLRLASILNLLMQSVGVFAKLNLSVRLHIPYSFQGFNLSQ